MQSILKFRRKSVSFNLMGVCIYLMAAPLRTVQNGTLDAYAPETIFIIGKSLILPFALLRYIQAFLFASECERKNNEKDFQAIISIRLFQLI